MFEKMLEGLIEYVLGSFDLDFSDLKEEDL